MPLLELPHTPGCVACGPANPYGLHLRLFVDPATEVIQLDYTPRPEDIGFTGIVHGGVLSTVIDEAMVWAASWAGGRFCVCGEMAVRFRQSAAVGQTLRVTARVESRRSRLIQTSCEITGDGVLLATATGKYVPLPDDRHAAFVATFVPDPATAEAAAGFAGPS